MLAVMTAGVNTSAGQDSTASGKVDRVVLVFKTHFDIGFTEMAVDVVQRYRTEMIDRALLACDRTRDLPPDRQFTWTIPGWPMHKILEDWPGQTTERKERILNACRQGRFVMHALPFTTHTELLELEDLVRGMGYASNLSRSMGLALPRDAKMTDVPSHTWVLPTMLTHAGVDFLHLGCNGASSPPEVPPLFWWEGPDGSKLLTMYTAAAYGTGLTPPADWPYRTWLALIHTGDNHGPPSPEQVMDLLKQIDAELPGVEVTIGRLSDFGDAIRAENPDLPVVRGDMPDSWIHGPMCDPAGARIARNIRPAITASEALNTHLRAWHVNAPNITDAVAAAYENSLLYGEHTWGGSLIWITRRVRNAVDFSYGEAWKIERAAGWFDRNEASWDEHTAYIKKARELVSPIITAEMKTLAGAVNVEGERIVVYNPLPWSRTGLVAISADWRDMKAVEAVNDGTVSPIEIRYNDLRFVAHDVPAMGYRTYRFAEADADNPQSELRINDQTSTLENRFFKMTVDARAGSIISLIDKRTGRQMVDPDASGGLGQYLYERFDADQIQAYLDAYLKGNKEWAPDQIGKPNFPSADEVPYVATSPQNFEVRFEQSAVAARAIMHAPASSVLNHAVTTIMTIYHDLPCIDIEMALHHKPADPWPEAGWLCLPLKVDQPRFAVGRLGSIVDPTTDFVPGSNHYVYAVNTGLTVAAPDGAGVGVCPIDSPLISLDIPGGWHYAKRFTPEKPNVYVNLFNNQWTTNFRLWTEGTWRSRVRLWAVEPGGPEKALVTPAQEARVPLLAARVIGPAGPLPPSAKGLELSRKGVLVTAFAHDPGNDATLLRLWEHANTTGPCEVRLPDGLNATKAQPVNLRGESMGDPITIHQGSFAVDLKPFSPASFMLRGD